MAHVDHQIVNTRVGQRDLTESEGLWTFENDGGGVQLCIPLWSFTSMRTENPRANDLVGVSLT
ncbi:hypothetical protein GCM10023209_24790 [Roseibacterium beibuensis]|uniref:Uncharacterized protein n=1 Tax=[Roseibacterium] beibuensis TaxID=1193142 RepID=A0ABP9LDC3_9RHOB